MSISIPASTGERTAVVLSRGGESSYGWLMRVLRNVEPQPLPEVAGEVCSVSSWFSQRCTQLRTNEPSHTPGEEIIKPQKKTR